MNPFGLIYVKIFVVYFFDRLGKHAQMLMGEQFFLALVLYVYFLLYIVYIVVFSMW